MTRKTLIQTFLPPKVHEAVERLHLLTGKSKSAIVAEMATAGAVSVVQAHLEDPEKSCPAEGRHRRGARPGPPDPGHPPQRTTHQA